MQRRPENELVMESAECVLAFHEAGLPGGPLLPIYHFNATAYAALLPDGATVLDLFCGSGRFLEFLLRGRPDLRGIGLDLSNEMLALADESLTDRGLAERVSLVHGDARIADTLVSAPIHGISCLSALHHCPDEAALVSVLSAVERLRVRNDCAVWLFDLVRPEQEYLLEVIPRVHEMHSRQALDPAFKRDWVTSLRAGWTFDEFRRALGEAGLALRGATADHSQLHWRSATPSIGQGVDWQGPASQPQDGQRAHSLALSLGFEHLGDG